MHAAGASRSSLAVHSPAPTLAEDARIGLTATPKHLPPKWFYDSRGSELFGQITELPEYYLTRTERSLLGRHAGEIAALATPRSLVELGSGAAEKTRLLLDALVPVGTDHYVPFDVCEDGLEAPSWLGAYPGLDIEGVVGDFQNDLALIPRRGPMLVAFLGSTIGNLMPGERHRFLGSVRSVLEPGESFLVGVDLVKDPTRLLAAYDDAAGVTAAFNRNVLSVINRELGADFWPDAFDHVALWDEDAEWIEMRLRSRVAQRVKIPVLGLEVTFGAGEEMRTEVSTKFRLGPLSDELAAAALTVVRTWTDPAGDFALVLARAGQ